MTRSVVLDLLKIFRASYTAVLPDKIIKKCVFYDPKSDTLEIAGDKFDLSSKSVYIVGTGKAVQYMAREMNSILGSKIKQGIISIPAKSLVSDTENVTSKLIYCEGAHDNLPDAAAEATARKIKNLASSLKQSDFLLVLISGGGSALLSLPKEPITLDEKLGLIKKLANSGADIKELNIVRKKISAIKGGKLAIAASPATTVTLILSDVVNDPLDIIASGPTIEDNDNIEKAINIIKKYNLYDELSDSIRKTLENKILHEQHHRDKVFNYLLGTNKKSILAAEDEAMNYGYIPIVLSRSVTGNVKDIATKYVRLAKTFCDYSKAKINIDQLKLQVHNLNIPGIKKDFIEKLKILEIKEKQLCLILGGEPTVEVKGTGKGGRNQQLALEFSNYIHQVKSDFDDCNVYILSAGTDGIDGPTDAAGAIGYLDLMTDCEKANIDANKFIENNDSFNFYKKFQCGMMHVMTGHTNTNVMDIHLIIIQRRS